MRNLLCAECTTGKKPGVRECYPGEWERVVFGVANTPVAERRTMFINGVPHPLPVNTYDCDMCAKPIKPGDRCCAWTVWTEDMGGIREWEHEFLTPCL